MTSMQYVRFSSSSHIDAVCSPYRPCGPLPPKGEAVLARARGRQPHPSAALTPSPEGKAWRPLLGSWRRIRLKGYLLAAANSVDVMSSIFIEQPYRCRLFPLSALWATSPEGGSCSRPCAGKATSSVSCADTFPRGEGLASPFGKLAAHPSEGVPARSSK